MPRTLLFLKIKSNQIKSKNLGPCGDCRSAQTQVAVGTVEIQTEF